MTNIDKYSFTVSLSKESFIDKETSAAMIGSIKPKPNASKKEIEECEKNKIGLRVTEGHMKTRLYALTMGINPCNEDS
jgi:hypothetical protein